MKKIGHDVSGSDIVPSRNVDFLVKNGIKAYVGHGQVGDVDIVVRSSAVGDDDPELFQAMKKGIKVMERMEFFSQYVKPTLGVTGTDGKSSTTCMIAWIALKNGLDPTLLCGAFSKGFDDSNFRFGKGVIVAEVDESDPKIEDVVSNVAVLTNLRYDHLERYKGDPHLQLTSIKKFLFNARKAVVPSDFDVFGDDFFRIGENGGLKYEKTASDFSTQRFKITYRKEEFFGELPIPGIYQVENAVTAIGASLMIGISVESSLNALKSYPGISRRMEILKKNEPIVVSDYAHTPNEVKAALDSVLPYFDAKDVVVIFEPHRYSRFEREYKNFAESLAKVKKVFVTDIFGAFEKRDEKKGVNVEKLVNEIEKRGTQAVYLKKSDGIEKILKSKAKIYLFMGAGNVDWMAHEFVRRM